MPVEQRLIQQVEPNEPVGRIDEELMVKPDRAELERMMNPRKDGTGPLEGTPMPVDDDSHDHFIQGLKFSKARAVGKMGKLSVD